MHETTIQACLDIFKYQRTVLEVNILHLNNFAYFITVFVVFEARIVVEKMVKFLDLLVFHVNLTRKQNN